MAVLCKVKPQIQKLLEHPQCFCEFLVCFKLLLAVVTVSEVFLFLSKIDSKMKEILKEILGCKVNVHVVFWILTYVMFFFGTPHSFLYIRPLMPPV